MGGIVGKLFREFAVTLSVAIAVSLLVSLTTTPMLCARFLKPRDESRHGRLYRASEGRLSVASPRIQRGLRWVLRHQALTLIVAIGTAVLNIYLFIIVPKGSSRSRTPAASAARTSAAQDISFPAMRESRSSSRRWCWRIQQLQQSPPSSAAAGPAAAATTWPHVHRPQAAQRAPRPVSADQVVNGLRRKLTSVPGATLFLQAQQDIQVGGRGSAAQYQYTLSDRQSERLEHLGAALAGRSARTCPNCATSPPTSRIRDWRQTSSSTAIPPRASASACRPSTRCSTTHSASARSPPCTPASTSTSSSWRSIRNTS